LPSGTQTFANPVSAAQLDELIARLLKAHSAQASDVVLAITGGEPLAQAEFLQAWLPTAPAACLLETAGIWAGRLKSLLTELDFVSLDVKDPADLREGEAMLEWQDCLQVTAHEAQRRLGSTRPLQFWSKFILTENTDRAWLNGALAEVATLAPASAVFLQPVTAAPQTPAALPMAEVLASLLENQAHDLDLRVLPQIHPLLEIR